MSKGGQIAIAVVSVFAAFAWIISSSEGTYPFFQSVTEMRAEFDPVRSRGMELRVRGFVVEGSIRRDLDAAEVWFAIQDPPAGAEGTDEAEPTSQPSQEGVAAVESLTLSVVYAGIDLPDLFRDGADVVVEGTLSDETFRATRIMAKCPSKYENKPEVPASPDQMADLGRDR